ncbi:MAG: toxin-antitoxin system YwqK family antitoxin [Flavobacteriales bacterium]
MLKVAAQVPEPCRATRQVCPKANLVKNCQESVAFDDENNTYLLRKDYATPYNGSCVSCYASNIVEEKLTFSNGKRQGTDTSFYKTGCIQAIQTYQLGKEQGATYIYFDSTNHVQFEIWYQSGLLHGPSIQFSKAGIQDTLMYKHYKNGKLDGPQRSYFSNGKVRKVSNYKDGFSEGAQITYNNNGQKESEIYFKAGKKQGTWNYYFDSGKVARTENWKEGKKNGEFITYDELGKVMQKEKFALDLPIGLHQTFYADGKLNYSCTYSSKGEKIEEYVIDQYGVKKMLYPLNEPKN